MGRRSNSAVKCICFSCKGLGLVLSTHTKWFHTNCDSRPRICAALSGLQGYLHADGACTYIREINLSKTSYSEIYTINVEINKMCRIKCRHLRDCGHYVFEKTYNLTLN